MFTPATQKSTLNTIQHFTIDCCRGLDTQLSVFIIGIFIVQVFVHIYSIRAQGRMNGEEHCTTHELREAACHLEQFFILLMW